MKKRVRALPVLAALLLGSVVPSPVTAAEPPGFEYFHTYAENEQVIDDAVANHPQIADKFSIGQSFEGREIWAIKISDNVDLDEDEPEVLFHGLSHGRERASHEMALYLIDMLTDGYAGDERIRDIVDTREVWIIPMLNPDGGEYDMSDGRWHRWRKNRQTIPNSTEVGIDLNRNYGFKWGCCGSGDADPSSDNYRGWAPEVATEVIAHERFVDSRVVDGRQQITVSIGYHSAGSQVLWPYAYTRTDVPRQMSYDDWRAMVALGQQMAAFNGYTAEQGSDLYIVDGDQADWEYNRHRIFSYTFEMAEGADRRYYPTETELAGDLAGNRGAALHLLELADCPHRADPALATTHCGPLNDDFEAGRGWVVNPRETDTATDGFWRRAVPGRTHNDAGMKQRSDPVSGMYDLVTGAAGGAINDDDVDGGITSVRSPAFALGASDSSGWTLDFWYTFAHNHRSGTSDYLRLSVGGQTVFIQQGFAGNRNAEWTHVTVGLDAYAGERVRLLIEAADGGRSSAVEAAIENLRVYRQP